MRRCCSFSTRATFWNCKGSSNSVMDYCTWYRPAGVSEVTASSVSLQPLPCTPSQQCLTEGSPASWDKSGMGSYASLQIVGRVCVHTCVCVQRGWHDPVFLSALLLLNSDEMRKGPQSALPARKPRDRIGSHCRSYLYFWVETQKWKFPLSSTQRHTVECLNLTPAHISVTWICCHTC